MDPRVDGLSFSPARPAAPPSAEDSAMQAMMQAKAMAMQELSNVADELAVAKEQV